MSRPVRPENVRLEHADGTFTPLELVYRGVDRGLHVWESASPFDPTSGDRLHVGVLPGRTTVRMAPNPPEEA